MRLAELASFAINGAVAKLRREVLAIVAAAACAVGAIYHLAAASVLALEPYAGAPGARLIVAGGFLLVGAIAIAIPRIYERNRKSLVQQVQAEAGARPTQLATIIDALSLGFSVARKSKRKQK